MKKARTNDENQENFYYSHKREIIDAMVEKTLCLPDGTEISAAQLFKKLYPDHMQEIDSFGFDLLDDFESALKGKKIALDMSKYEGLTVGLPYYLDFAIYHKNPGKNANTANSSKSIKKFAEKWIEIFETDPFDPYMIVEDLSFPSEMRSFGFEMDCGKSFNKKYPGCFNDWREFEKYQDTMIDVDLVGSAVFSQWRYYNHWAYSVTELANPDVRHWFITALNKLKELDHQVVKFRKEDPVYGCFSNFAPCPMGYEGLFYKNSEAAWQSLKTTDPEIRSRFTTLEPDQAKKLGKSVDLREDWEDVKYDLMVSVCLAKFTQNGELRSILVSTGNARIIEDTTGWHDGTWGVCSCKKCKGEGKNLLGKALMEVRRRLI